jgi:hypothetical protein
MIPVDQHTLSFMVRWIHVCSMAFLLGTSVFLFALAFQSRGLGPGDQGRLLLGVAQRFEFLFWVAIGVQVITGIGNLGAFGANLPPPASIWGSKFVVKLSLFLLFMLLSDIRSLVVVHLGVRAITIDAARMSRLARGIYGSTGVTLAVLVLIAVSLAH